MSHRTEVGVSSAALAAVKYGNPEHPRMPSPPISELLPLSSGGLEMVAARVEQYVAQHRWALDDAVGGPVSDSPGAGRAAAP